MRAGTCGCFFGCSCFRDHELEQAPGAGGVTILGAMRAVARTAATGHRHATDNAAKVVFYRTGHADQLPHELKTVARAPTDGLHILLIWNGDNFKSSARLQPVELIGAVERELSSQLSHAAAGDKEAAQLAAPPASPPAVPSAARFRRRARSPLSHVLVPVQRGKRLAGRVPRALAPV